MGKRIASMCRHGLRFYEYWMICAALIQVGLGSQDCSLDDCCQSADLARAVSLAQVRTSNNLVSRNIGSDTFSRAHLTRNNALNKDLSELWRGSRRLRGAETAEVATCPPVVGQTGFVIPDQAQYERECAKGGLMDMFSPNDEGVIEQVDLSGQGSVYLKGANTEAWVPIRALQGLEGCAVQGGTAAPTTSIVATTTTQAPTTTQQITTTVVTTTTVAATMAQSQAPTTVPIYAVTAGLTTTTIQSVATDYLLSGCRRGGSDVQDVYTVPDGMTPSKCLVHCRKKQGMRYFALTAGAKCFCLSSVVGDDLSADNCDIGCSGDPEEFCGGTDATSVYTMIDCSPPTAEEQRQEAAAKSSELLASYSQFEDESCAHSDDNLVEVGGSSKMEGTVDDCKEACWKGKGASQCNGFTYDHSLSRCTFYLDVFSGSIVKKAGMTCFWKKV